MRVSHAQALLATLFMIYLIHEKGVENCPFFAD